MLDSKIGTTNLEERESWLEKTLKNIPAGSSILDAGAGELRYKKFCSHLAYTSQDFAQYNGKGNREALQTGNWDQTKLDIVSDIKSIPVTDDSFDAVLCVEVLEHLPEPSLAVKEFSRIVKPGGSLIITAPFCSLTHFAPYHFATGFNRYFYETTLKNNGFRIVEITPNGNFYEYLAQEIRRLPWVIHTYSNSKRNILEKLIFGFERITFKVMLKILEKYSEKDNGSSELLCFGYQVLAEKIK